mmetsp:Transcript_2708/g.6500  ORF Transcript_2708/g.6500 Transcript_2708/m.6500 type:complete len:247 (-) Transcript_2708:1371-2111(-)
MLLSRRSPHESVVRSFQIRHHSCVWGATPWLPSAAGCCSATGSWTPLAFHPWSDASEHRQGCRLPPWPLTATARCSRRLTPRPCPCPRAPRPSVTLGSRPLAVIHVHPLPCPENHASLPCVLPSTAELWPLASPRAEQRAPRPPALVAPILPRAFSPAWPVGAAAPAGAVPVGAALSQQPPAVSSPGAALPLPGATWQLRPLALSSWPSPWPACLRPVLPAAPATASPTRASLPVCASPLPPLRHA